MMWTRRAIEHILRRAVYVIAWDVNGELGRVPVEADDAGLPRELNYRIDNLPRRSALVVMGFADVNGDCLCEACQVHGTNVGDAVMFVYDGITEGLSSMMKLERWAM